MSLEQAVKENTEALNTLIEVFKNQKTVNHMSIEVKKGGKKTDEVAAPAVEVVKAEVLKISYEEVKKATLELAKKDQPACIAILQSFSAKNATELKPEQYADYVGLVNAKTAEMGLV